MRLMIPLLMLFLAMALTGCDKENQLRRWQQEQVELLQQQARENAEAARDLVKADAQARQEVAAVHHDLHTERLELGQQRDKLESDRKEIAAARQRVPLIASAFQGGAVLLACALGLGICGWLLMGLSKRDADSELEDLLVLQVGGEATPLSTTRRLNSNEPTIRPAIELQRPDPLATPHLAA